MKRIMPALAAALAAAVLPAAQPGTATLTVSGYKNSTTLTDFPVLVRVPSSISLLCGPDGSAMRFYAADGVTELAHEIDTWNYGGDSCVWVKLPALAAGTTFQMSYGGAYGARATTDADVWTGYAGVWHLSEDGVNPPIIDSTQNGMNGLARAAPGSGLAAGRIGRARLTAGGRDHAYGIVVDATNGIPQRAVADSLGTDFTASFWMNPQGNGVGDFSFGFLIDRRKGEYNNPGGWGVRLHGGGAAANMKLQVYSADEKPSASTYDGTLTQEQYPSLYERKAWSKVDIRWYATSATAGAADIYTNGVFVETLALPKPPKQDETTNIGIGGSTQANPGNTTEGKGRQFRGYMDEVRLRRGGVSADWIKADFDTVNDTSFVAFDSVPALEALDYYVTPAGTDGNAPAAPYGSWATAANDFATLSAALPVTDAPIAPVIIHVAPGVYAVTNPISLAIPGITLVSDDGTGATARETTILDGGYPARTNRLASVTAANVTIRGLTFRNGMVAGENDGGAIYADSASENMSVIDCTFTNCIARHGGAIRLGAANAWLEGCDFTDCHAWTTTTKYSQREGGGVNVSAAATGSVITNCSFTGCTAYQGGAVRTPTANAQTGFSERAYYTIISGCTFTRNAPVQQTGAGHPVDTGYSSDAGNPMGGGVCGKAWVENCRFDANYTPVGNTACFCPAIGFDYNTVVTNCVFENHSSALRGIVGPKGGVTNEALIVGCVFRGNTCRNMLGGQSIITVDRCVFTNNAAAGNLFWGGSQHVVRNSLYAYNWQPLWMGSQRYENCTIVSNTCGVYIGYGVKSSPILVNCYIGGNTNPPTRLDSYRGNANFGYNLGFWGDNGFAFSPLLATNCVIEGAHTVEKRNTAYTFDLFDYEPSGTCAAITDLVAAKGAGFVDAANGDWRLRRRSPLRDAGLLLPWMADGATDLDGNPRLTDRFGKPFAPDALPDIGCYECQERKALGTMVFMR